MQPFIVEPLISFHGQEEVSDIAIISAKQPLLISSYHNSFSL